MSRRARASVLALLVGLLGAACADVEDRVLPACDDATRLAIVAQSVPAAAYVPCIASLPAGWSFEGLDVTDSGTTMRLASDRSDRVVEVELRARCETAGATAVTPRDEGVRTYHLVESIEPRVAGRLLDVFPGGCVITSYDFERGAHVPLFAEAQAALGLRSRIELRQELERRIDVDLDP